MNPAHHYVQVVQDDLLFFNFFGPLACRVGIAGNEHRWKSRLIFRCMEIVILRIFVLRMPTFGFAG